MDTEQDNGVVKLHKDEKRARSASLNLNLSETSAMNIAELKRRLSAANINGGLRKKNKYTNNTLNTLYIRIND